ncbi:MAG: aa3-type cytochrome c oxidase subunit IV [Pseudomonadota bacterium]
MAGTDYVHGEMDITEQSRTWNGFMTATVWGSFIIALVVGYATLTLALGMHWMVALGLLVVGGLIGGAAMGMGGAWFATVLGLAAIALVVQVMISLFSLL